MKKYCLDTSGLSNPLESMPEDIYSTLWGKIKDCLSSGCVAVTTEIFDELILIPGSVGAHIKSEKKNLVLEIADNSWDWKTYVAHSIELNKIHHAWISEYNGGSPKTICLKDMTTIALAKTLKLPVVSMEVFIRAPESKHRRIPNICQMEGIRHMTFNEFLRAEGISI